jgi:hypothetical protein
MLDTRITIADRRRYADQLRLRWFVMGTTGFIGLIASIVVWIWGNPESRADEMIVLVVTLLAVGLLPLVEWGFRFAFARVKTLSDRLEQASAEIARLTAESARLNGALRIEDFDAEAAEFRGLSTPFWDRLERAFGRYNVSEVPSRIHTLRDMVDAAEWPDRIKRKPKSLVEPEPATVDEVLIEFVTCVYPQYGFELIPKEAYDEFDLLRRNVRRRIRQWGDRLQSVQRDEVREWLRAQIGRSDAGTIKLAWYLDVAKAERASVKSPVEDAHYRSVRDAVEAGAR